MRWRSFFPTGGDSGDGRRRTLDALLSAVQFKPGRAAVVTSQHEHEPAAKTYSVIFCYIGSAGIWPRSGQLAEASIQQKMQLT